MNLDSSELLNVSAWQMVFGGAGLAVLALLLLYVWERVDLVLAWLLWLYALNRLSASATGLASLGSPALAILVAWIQLGEVPTVIEAVGMTLIVAALAWLSVLGWRRSYSQ